MKCLLIAAAAVFVAGCLLHVAVRYRDCRRQGGTSRDCVLRVEAEP